MTKIKLRLHKILEFDYTAWIWQTANVEDRLLILKEKKTSADIKIYGIG